MPDILSKEEIDAMLTQKKRILIVYDASTARRIISDPLEKISNCVITNANSAEKALEVIGEQSYDLMITGWNIPKLDGLALIQEIRSHENFKQLPILMATNRHAKKDVAAAIGAGANDYLIIPSGPDALKDKVVRLLSKKSASKEISSTELENFPAKLSQNEIDKLLKVMSQNQIDALLTATDRPRKKSVANKPIITYDFKHPRRVSKDQARTLENLHSNLSRMMASSFSAIQRSVVDCDIAFVDQTTYTEFIMSLSNPSCSFTFTMEPLGGPAILDFSLPVVYSFIDRQFGGTGGNPPSETRPLTSIERTVMGKVVTRTLADLEATWEALLKIQVTDAELETNPEFMQVCAPSDTVILIAFEMNSQHASGLVNLCYPYFTLEPVMAYLNVQTWASRERGRGESGREDRIQQLDGVHTPITAILARAEVALQDLANIRVGDVLRMDTPQDGPSTIFVADRPKFKGRPTRIGNRYAVQITERIRKADELLHMTEVQKTDTGQM